MTFEKYRTHAESCEICTSPASLAHRNLPHVLRYLPDELEIWQLSDCQVLALFLTAYQADDGLPAEKDRRYFFDHPLNIEDFFAAIGARELVPDLMRLLKQERRVARRTPNRHANTHSNRQRRKVRGQ